MSNCPGSRTQGHEVRPIPKLGIEISEFSYDLDVEDLRIGIPKARPVYWCRAVEVLKLFSCIDYFDMIGIETTVSGFLSTLQVTDSPSLFLEVIKFIRNVIRTYDISPAQFPSFKCHICAAII